MAQFLRHTTDDSDWIECVQADAVIEIADAILENGDPRFLSHGDGIVTFHCSNGEISYGLRDYDDLRETWVGVRADIPPEYLDELSQWNLWQHRDDDSAHAREG